MRLCRYAYYVVVASSTSVCCFSNFIMLVLFNFIIPTVPQMKFPTLARKVRESLGGFRLFQRPGRRPHQSNLSPRPFLCVEPFLFRFLVSHFSSEVAPFSLASSWRSPGAFALSSWPHCSLLRRPRSPSRLLAAFTPPPCRSSWLIPLAVRPSCPACYTLSAAIRFLLIAFLPIELNRSLDFIEH